MYDSHTVTFTADGPQDAVHPEQDVSPCAFGTYLDTLAPLRRSGPWAFQWIENPEEPTGGYWNGTEL